MFKYEWIWEKNNAGNFQLVKHQPLKFHEDVIVFSKNRHSYFPQGLFECNKVQSNVGKAGKIGHLGSEKLRSNYKQTATNYPRSILRFNRDKGLHPTQKPVALFEYLIKTYTNEGDTVLDNAAGSGTTGVACKNLNRNFILIEKEPEYVKICEERIRAVPESLF
jgi:site-specific DNA-methyltransferase (adenine-specific)